MMYEMFLTPGEVAKRISSAARKKRLSLDLSQESLSSRSGVSLGVLKKFERTGQISLSSILKLALVLGSLSDFSNLFKAIPLENLPTLDDLIKQKERKRGRK